VRKNSSRKNSRKASKTQRQGLGQFKGSQQLNQKIMEIKETEKKPVSSRSNNLEIWLAKRRALQKQSDNNIITEQQEVTPAKATVEFISEESKDAEDKKSGASKDQDISYLSKLQCSLVFEPAEQLVKKEEMRELQKSHP